MKFSKWGEDEISLIGDAAHPMTPNLGQGGALSLEDSIELSSLLLPVLKTKSIAYKEANIDKIDSKLDTQSLDNNIKEKEEFAGLRLQRNKEIADALRLFEATRYKRILKLAIKSYVFGFLLQIEFSLITFVRDNIVLPFLFSPKPFLEHTNWIPPAYNSKQNVEDKSKVNSVKI